MPRGRRVELERLRRTDRAAWVALIRRLVDELAEGRRVKARAKGEHRRAPTEFDEESADRPSARDGVTACPKCLGHKQVAVFHLLEPGDQDPRASYFEKGKLLEESLVWFTYKGCELCRGRGQVSVTAAAGYAKAGGR